MIIQPILVEHFKTIQKNFKNRHLTVGASEIGLCARQTFYKKHLPGAIDDEEESLGASARGNAIEKHTLVPALRKHFGANILYTGKDQKTLISGESSATPDGLLINVPKNYLAEFGIKDVGKSRELLVEFKSIDPRIQLRAPKPEHERQANQQIGVMRETTQHRPEHCLIVYVNASFMDDVAEFVVTFDPERYERQKVRAKRILSAKTAREVQPEGWIKGGKSCEYCAFSRACTELRTEMPDEDKDKKADPQLIEELRQLAIEEEKWDTISSEAAEKKREIQIQLKERLLEKGLRKIKEPDLSITWYPIKGRITLDMDALRAAAEKAKFNIAPFEKQGDASDGLRISVGETIKPAALPKAVIKEGVTKPPRKKQSRQK